MAIYRLPHKGNYVKLSTKLIRNPNLSATAKMIMCIALSLPPDWDYNIPGLTYYCREGRSAVQAAIKELEANGFVARHRERINGKLGRMIYDFFEDSSLNEAYCAQMTPNAEMPAQAAPTADHPAQDILQIHNNNIYDNIIINNNQSINHDRTAEDQIRRQIEYDILVQRYDHRLLDDLVAIMVSTMMAQTDTIAISKSTVLPTGYVRDCMAKINALHIEQIMDKLDDTKPTISNVRGYLLTALINAANTMSMTYQYGDY